MTDRIVMKGEFDYLPYKGGPRDGKKCRPRERHDRTWCIDPIMLIGSRGFNNAVSKGQYEYRAEPEPHMLWIPNAHRAKQLEEATWQRDRTAAAKAGHGLHQTLD